MVITPRNGKLTLMPEDYRIKSNFRETEEDSEEGYEDKNICGTDDIIYGDVQGHGKYAGTSIFNFLNEGIHHHCIGMTEQHSKWSIDRNGYSDFDFLIFLNAGIYHEEEY